MLGQIKKVLFEIWINSLSGWNILPLKVRVWMYRVGGLNIDKTCRIKPGVIFVGNNVEFEKNVYLNRNTYLNSLKGKIFIGENTFLACDVLLSTITHELGSPECRAGKIIGADITIGKGCWIGVRTTILENVNIGDGCIIAAGSVVINNCETNALYAGVPAKKIRTLTC